jgi:hypothetical protein
MSDLDTERLHAEMSRRVAMAVAGLLPQFAPHGMTIEALIEGAAKGVAMSIMTTTGGTLEDVANVFEELAEGMRANAPSDINDLPSWRRRH